MDRDRFNQFCSGLVATSHVVQWGGADVWKVGSKVFAVAGWSDSDHAGISFKVTPLSFEILKEQDGLRPAPYLASRGMTWIQSFEPGVLTDDDLQAYLERSHAIIASGLSKKKQRELGLLPET
ncbi:MmcQ/YjbR family DNA-binding protein [Maricaulis sp.]|jgi:predicted DNA-binding protein (MmcQ/YjbR family)|uniref:MmcQ/YjbR family DNA-binding protein n=1 Tax=Maricaulis sp. TaxID=1486257 RepID=UPI002636F777|nr:MmcQ/YjbR family DNA-binding protein [Maricaulis sp.]MDF1767525.1 MmcQ/YjbR family DNA-binding protein [Maricaulis sp.]